ncbi:DUF429 domain-containing protein [Roseococcus sp. XZZS9]|uniref:DUF429 domain-containing protein n=1 Tax=Roseococcus pinisoli TaxID=2835040 RepID=A0ABS5Q7S6_9PROT|nr:DUF429 domain-containing protein [Roseococcus pinisoli]MBS7809462.1 DUF429 domain-containing protein [Roseococcus pinisoli]
MIGFDSAWTDNPKAPGAICAVSLEEGRPVRFHPPRLVSFDGGLEFIRQVRSPGATLVALDQPTVVPNLTSMRPVERAAASLVSWMGGGVQPSNRGRIGMFCDDAPIWWFLRQLKAMEDPELARIATDGLHLMEVFPAISLAAMDADFFGYRRGPRYNPARRTFRIEDWRRVAKAAAREAASMGFDEIGEWCRVAASVDAPRKADQDRLDAVLCLLIALRWRLRPREESLILGNTTTGYMVMPAAPAVRERLAVAALRMSVPMDGHLPTGADRQGA